MTWIVIFCKKFLGGFGKRKVINDLGYKGLCRTELGVLQSPDFYKKFLEALKTFEKRKILKNENVGVD